MPTKPKKETIALLRSVAWLVWIIGVLTHFWPVVIGVGVVLILLALLPFVFRDDEPELQEIKAPAVKQDTGIKIRRDDDDVDA
ncbi:MAG: hypothetical protein ABFD54_09410 [Armatimonadota bacterium]|nr:hypothetical protein [bacterium]